MKINFNVISNIVSDVVAKTGKAMRVCEVAYKDLDSGKIEVAKVNSFSKLFSKATELQVGMSFTGTKEKEGDYWNWTTFVPFDGTPSPAVATKSASASPVKSTYETAEERAKKQVYIIRQSAINYSIALLSIGAKAPPSTEQVLKVAEEFASWVFAQPALSFDSMQDDIPVQ